jgi:ABC-type branched-subunit amino acid transport system substrate-binding protein
MTRVLSTMGTGRGRRLAAIGAAAVGLLASACGNAAIDSGNGSSSGGQGGAATTVAAADLQKKVKVTETGVTDDEIRVAGVVSKTNPTGGHYEDAAKGVQAYFDMVNAGGGIYGRKLVLTNVRDDKVVANADEVQSLISEDGVFAAAPIASLLFGGADKLAEEKIPTFGWNINEEWTGPLNLFGEKGSFLCIDCGNPNLPYLAKQIGARKVGLLAYAVDQSTACLEGNKEAFARWPSAPIVFEDASIPYGGDLAVPVNRMKEAGVDLVLTCIDTNGAINLGREMKKQGLGATQVMPNGYDPDLIRQFAADVEGSYVMVGTFPFEAEQPPAALTRYEEWIRKAGGTPNEVSLAGWLDADLLYQGLVRAGPEFSRQKVIDAINSMTAWTADGIKLPTNWTVEHTASTGDACFAAVKIEGGAFKPVFGEPGKPFVCMKENDPQALENAKATS